MDIDTSCIYPQRCRRYSSAAVCIPPAGCESLDRMTSRRVFLGGLAGAPMVYGSAAARKLKLGLIGAGWYGLVDLNAAYEVGDVECAAVCDIDAEHLEAAALEVEKKQGSRPRLFKDYRELIAMPGLDALIIATPPHWHALQFIEACRKGVAVYQEKPLAYDVREVQAMVAAQKKAGNVVQIGFQRRESDSFADAARYVRDGKIGKLVQVEAQINYKAAIPDTTVQDPPAGFDWETWCGPAPKLPYRPSIGHKAWRLEKTTGHGHLVDWGIHLIDAIRMMTGETMPRTVQAAGGLYDYQGKITTPDTLSVQWEFERFPLAWHHRLWGSLEYTPEINNGVLFYGENGTVFASDSRWEILPRGKGEQKQVIEAKRSGTAMGVEHMRNFLEALRTGQQPDCPIEQGAMSTATVHLAMIAYESASKVEWDRQHWQVQGNPAAARLLKREYRKPYTHPYAS